MPEASTYAPVTDALNRAAELDEDGIAAVLNGVSSMPQSTTVFANPALHKTAVDCAGTKITLNIRSFALRGIVTESEIIADQLSPAYVIFVGLFGRRPETDTGGIDEEAVLTELINRKFYEVTTARRENSQVKNASLIRSQNLLKPSQKPGPKPSFSISQRFVNSVTQIKKELVAQEIPASSSLNLLRPTWRMSL